ncbi:MAG: hypothetical protein J4G13_09585 [Dehalococcoidia bacterium]|nr:hypothetical protein [Dehalococcoidia bacterium]
MPDEKYADLPLCRLELDPDNPRLPRDHDWASESENRLLQEFFQRYNLIDLARSIADKGFTPRRAEALLAIDHPSKTNRYLIVEGNRRLAVLKLLTNPRARAVVGATSGEWSQLAEEASVWDLNDVPVVVYPDKSALEDYLGFRHITGPRPWRPEAKARYIARLLGNDRTIDDVVRRIGSNHRTVRRFAEAHAIFTQATEEGIPMDQAELGFGVFYNALDQDGVREFLGLGRQIEIRALPVDPVPVSRLTELAELVGLLFGDPSKGTDRVITDSRQLRKLGQVLASGPARANLLRNRDLERAWRISGGGRDELIATLREIRIQLAEVNGQAQEYSDDGVIKEGVLRIYNLANETAERYGVI